MLAFPVIEDFSYNLLSRLFRRDVLIVEDDTILKPIMTGVLHTADRSAEVQWVKSAESAMRRINRQRYELVIADYFLQGTCNGLDLYQYCLAKCPKTRFLLMSAMEFGTMQKLIKKGQSVPLFLQKPFLIKDCVNIIAELLQGKDH